MPHMELYTYYGGYYLVDSPGFGTTLVPDDVVPEGAAPEDFCDYVEADDDPSDWEITHHVGWYGRYSAPGYMDCTDWSWADTEEELAADLKNLYGDEEDEPSDEFESPEETRKTPRGWDSID